MMMDNNMVHDKMHMRCCWKPMAGKLLWLFGLVSFLAGLLGYWQGGTFWGVSVMTWYWNALVAGVLAQGVRSKHGWCGCGTCTNMGSMQGK